MQFTTKQLIQTILETEELEKTKKVELLDRIATTGRITKGYYLKKVSNNNLECWFRNVDEDGTTYHGPTDYLPEQVVGEFIREQEQPKITK